MTLIDKVHRMPQPTTQSPGDPLLNVRDVARWIGVSDRTIQQWAEAGQLRGFKIGRAWRFRKEDVEDFIRRHETLPQ
jgi:excisionase family DNA binding protein